MSNQQALKQNSPEWARDCENQFYPTPPNSPILYTPYSHVEFERADNRNDTKWFETHWEKHSDEMLFHVQVTPWDWDNFHAWVKKPVE